MPDETQTAYLLKQIDTSVCGKGCQMRLGDLNGDGCMEIIMVQPDSGFDERYFPHSAVCATALGPDGEVLWQIGSPDPEAKAAHTDIPAQIYDIDNDGMNEFLCVMNDEFCIFDGNTGTLKRKYPLPDPHAHDCIIIADLEGRGYAQNIILKNRYHQLWAFDVNFNVMWTYKGNIGHYPWPYDINGDGRDELIAGYTVLGGDGEVLWSIDEAGHADSVWVGNFKKCGSGDPLILIGGAAVGAYTSSGEQLWRRDNAGELKSVFPANLNRASGAAEIVGLDRDCAQGIDNLFILTPDGEQTLCKSMPVPGDGSRTMPVYDFASDKTDSILASNRSGLSPAAYDGMLEPVCTLPSDGYMQRADIYGDGTCEILVYDGEKLEIYTAAETDLPRTGVLSARPQPKRLYNQTIYCSGELTPSRYDINCVTGDYSADALTNWAQRYAQDSEYDNVPISRADFTVLLVRALKLHAYERESFADVYPRDYYYEAVCTAKKLGIAEGNLGRFTPDAPITAEAAVEMINRAGRECFLMTDGELSKRSAAKIVLELLRTN